MLVKFGPKVGNFESSNVGIEKKKKKRKVEKEKRKRKRKKKRSRMGSWSF